MLRAQRRRARDAREAEMLRDGYPRLHHLHRLARLPRRKSPPPLPRGDRRGWTAFKMKVGPDLDDNIRRAALMREEIGAERLLMMDANQCWDVGEAIGQMKALAAFDPWWIEEPTSPDDVLGTPPIARAIAPIGVATGEVVPEPRHLQAAAAGERASASAGRQLPHGRRQRGPGRPADGREVRRAGLPARRRRRPLRVRAAPRRSSTTSP